MRRTNLIAGKEAMATKRLIPATRREICRGTRGEQASHHQALRMNWIVTTDENGNRQLRMCWSADREDQSAPGKERIERIHSLSWRRPRSHRRIIPAAAMMILFALSREVAAAQDGPSGSSPAPQNIQILSAAPDAGNGDPGSGPAEAPAETMLPHFTNTRFWLSGQANFIFNTNPPFHAAFNGANSFGPNYQKATSRVLTLYGGVRLNDSTEILVDVEEAGGAALSTGLGLAGFPNLDIVRNPLLTKEPYLARAMVHKVIALSSDKIESDRNFLSLFDELPRRRLELRFGKFSLVDFFDQNSVGSDTHFQFANWVIDNNGAYDYAADTRGYTVGATADYEDRNWGFRFAEALMPLVANGPALVYKFWQAHSENFEYELRHGLLPRRGGVVRLLAYTNYANMGIYRDAVAQFEQGVTPVPEITDHPWHITRKYGFGINIEQPITPYLTAFGRFGWDNGKTESFAYTEVDQTFAGGLGANGRLWHRKLDRAGIAFSTDGISKDHQNYLANGGLGFLLGDGALVYGRENIVESYYTAHVWRGIYLGPGLQHIENPGYNRARGPVLVPTFRGHVEF